MQGVQDWFLVRELKSYMLCGILNYPTLKMVHIKKNLKKKRLRPVRNENNLRIHH